MVGNTAGKTVKNTVGNVVGKKSCLSQICVLDECHSGSCKYLTSAFTDV